VKRELLVRYLDAAVPAVLHRARRFTYAERYAGATVPGDAGEPATIAALRVFGEFADLLDGRLLCVVAACVTAAGEQQLSARVTAVYGELGSPQGLSVNVVRGDSDADLSAALTDAGAFGAPIFTYYDAAGATVPEYDLLVELAANPGGELLLAFDVADADAATTTESYRQTLLRAGYGLISHVELVDQAGTGQLLFFATKSDKHLDTFKETLWAVDEFAGVRYRDPRDAGHALLDISLSPHLTPLRRTLLQRVTADGADSVEDLREYTRRETVYRASDATRALTAMLGAGTVAREPERGRLAAETVIRPVRGAA
jgi:hypothetical protein